MKEQQTTFDIFGDDTSQITLNDSILDDLDELTINDPEEELSIEPAFEVKVDSNVTPDLERDINEVQQKLERLEDTLDLARKDIEVDVHQTLKINTEDLSSMDEINKEINIVSENRQTKAISLAQDDVFITGAADYGKVNILTLGIGGCGVNAIGRMYDDRSTSISLVAMDTSKKTLESSNADHKILLGEEIFKGHGSGGNFDKVHDAIQAEKEKIQGILKDVDMLFITGGIGKGTGSVGLVEIGKIARQMGILTIGFAVLPSPHEVDSQVVRKYYNDFIDNVDSNIIVENARVFEVYSKLPILKAMQQADKMLVEGIKGISDLITSPGKINLDYADVKTAFSNKGSVVMGFGYGSGENAVIDAIEQSIKSDIVNFNNIKNARDIIFNISCPRNTVSIGQVNRGTERIYSYNEGDQIDHLFFGYSYDEDLEDKVKVTFVATGTGDRNLDDIMYKDAAPSGDLFAGAARAKPSGDLFAGAARAKPRKLKENPSTANTADSTETKKLEMPDFFSKK